jgi:hypothetical protein
MPEIGKLSTWLIENGGTMMTWIIVSIIVLFTLWVKKDEWFGSSKNPAVPKPVAKATEPEPKKEPEKEPVSNPKPAAPVPAPTQVTPQKEDKRVDGFRAGLWRAFGGLIGVSIFLLLILIVVQNMEAFKHSNVIEYKIDPTVRADEGGRSAFFTGQTHYLNEVIQFCYFDKELGLTRIQAWDCTDMVKHESRFQMYNSDGSVFVGEQNPLDTGVFMINLKESAKEIVQANCNIESFECQKKVFRLIYLEKRSFERWVAYSVVKNLTVTTYKVTANPDEWSGEFYLPRNDSCFLDPERKMEMMGGGDGKPVEISPEFVPFMEAPFLRFRSKDGSPATVTIMCRQ